LAKNWIKGAIKHPGALRAKAKAKHLVKGDEPLSNSDLGILAKHANATTNKEVNLAKTLKGFRK
jgi:hypothetical protein